MSVYSIQDFLGGCYSGFPIDRPYPQANRTRRSHYLSVKLQEGHSIGPSVRLDQPPTLLDSHSKAIILMEPDIGLVANLDKLLL